MVKIQHTTIHKKTKGMQTTEHKTGNKEIFFTAIEIVLEIHPLYYQQGDMEHRSRPDFWRSE